MSEAPALRVLHVEDSPTDAALMEEAIADHVDLIRLEDLDDYNPDISCDLILLDLILPSTQEVETVKKCARLIPKKPIIVLSQVSSVSVQAQCLTAGADYFFRKGEQSAATILRAMSAAIHARLIRETQMGEEQATREYIKTVTALLEKIQKRLDMLLSP